MRRLKSIDEIYSEVRDYDLVITNDAALETALNARVDTVRLGTFAVTPRHLARDMCYRILQEPEVSDLELVALVSEDTDLDFKYVYSEIQNFREIRKYTPQVRENLTTNRSRRVYDSYSSLPTRERAMGGFDSFNEPHYLEGKRVAVIGVDLYDDLDKHMIPVDFDEIDIFTDGEYSIDEFREVGNDRQLAENAVDLIVPEKAGDYAIVFNSSAPIADAVRAALYRRGLPFVNSLSVRDLTPVRDYIGFLSACMDYETVRVGHVKELFAALNGFFVSGREGFLLSKISEDDMKNRARELREIMRTAYYDGLTFGAIMSEVCDSSGRPLVGMVLKALGLTDETVKPSKLSELIYAVDNVTELKHNEQIPENERTGVLLADCTNSVFIDKPVVIYLGMEQDWNVSVVGKRYIDAEAESEKNALRFTAMLQQGHRRVYCVNATKGGKKARPCLTFDQIMGNPCKSFSDIAPVVSGRWSRSAGAVPFSRGETMMDGTEEYDRPFSKSSFDAYYSCPRCYMYRASLPSEDKKSNEFGTLIHSFAELYACHPEIVEEMGLESFVTMISDRYSGLSSPTMEEVDTDAVRQAMRNIKRYIDMRGVRAPLDSSNGGKKHPNRFMTELGIDSTSTACETDYPFSLHSMHGEFDLYWNGVVTDYKTGKAKTGQEIAKAMTPGSGVKYPEFQPLMYLAIASTLPGDRGEFEMLYAMDNDVESVDDGFDIRRNIRTIRVVDGNVKDVARNSPALREAFRNKVKKDFKPVSDEILDAALDSADDDFLRMGEDGEVKLLSTDVGVINHVLDTVPIKDKEPQKSMATALGYLEKLLTGRMVVTDTTVEVPSETLEAFLEMVDTMHEEAVRLSRTELPARPVIDCRDCDFFEACTRDVVNVKGGEDDE